jgi:hypothetical protein
MPRWVKMAGVAVGVLILLAVALMVVGGEHGPERHAPGGGAGVDHAATDGVPHH